MTRMERIKHAVSVSVNIFAYAVVIFTVLVAVSAFYSECSRAYAESPQRIPAKGLVGESDSHDADYQFVLRVFEKHGSTIARGAMNYSAIFKPILPGTLPFVAERRRDIVHERNIIRVRQIDRAERWVTNYENGPGRPTTCDPDEEGNRSTDAANARRHGWIRLYSCGPSCFLPLSRHVACEFLPKVDHPTCRLPLHSHPDNPADCNMPECNEPNCLINFFWRHRTPEDGPRHRPPTVARGHHGAVSATLARGRR